MSDPQLIDVLRMAGVNKDARVVDVGCDSGGLLESLIEHAGLLPDHAYGVDPNTDAVIVGRDLCTDGVTLLVGEATDMAPSATFTHVICVGSLMYMPQAKSIAAMADMVAPGGKMILVYEMIRADFMWMTLQGWGMRLRALRDFPYGVLTNLVWQPPMSIFGRRAFVSTRRTLRQLERLGFVPRLYMKRNKGRKFLGKATQRILVVQKPSP